MAAKHSANATPPLTSEQEQAPPPESMDQAAQVVRDVMGADVAWERGFRKHEDAEGATIYVDQRTGQVYDQLPELAMDGRDA